jgi:hypothetical protein
MTARVNSANDLGALLTEQQPRTDCTATAIIPDVPIDFMDNFRMAPGQNELQQSLDVMAAQATVNGVPPDKL